MNKVLKLYNTFTRTVNPVEIAGKLVQTGQCNQQAYGSLYICGPTVYSDCHVGHALTYIRSDLLRRFLKSYFNVKLITVMNITDIDDKILARTSAEYQLNENTPSDPSSHPFNQISERYFDSFVNDMNTMRNLQPDIYHKVSRQIPVIAKFICKLEQNGQAYRAANGDICFSVNSVPNYIGRIDPRQEEPRDEMKRDTRDFVLWKRAKKGEPVWTYTSQLDGHITPGRPGWHVQCSAISSAMFGKNLDIHFGGKDLIFPHHYNEEACCCAYHNLDTSKSLHVWAKHWLHSGHMVLRDTKMSKSLGNVVLIKEFLSRSSVNSLRLLCVQSHYRTDIQFDDELIERIEELDHRLSAFNSFLIEALSRFQDEPNLCDCIDDSQTFLGNEIESALNDTYESILAGICEDMDLNRGLESILELASRLYAKDPKAVRPSDIIASWSLFTSWCDTCGLNYGCVSESSNRMLLDLAINFRKNVRLWAIDELKSRRTGQDRNSLDQLLGECDKVRGQIDKLGFVIRDPKAK